MQSQEQNRHAKSGVKRAQPGILPGRPLRANAYCGIMKKSLRNNTLLCFDRDNNAIGKLFSLNIRFSRKGVWGKGLSRKQKSAQKT
jgi:hypothetical protein